MKRVVIGVSGLLCAVLLARSPASAQGVAAVAGVVRDGHGTPQMGALVELLGPHATVVAQTYTDDHGRYSLSVAAAGRYQLRASAAFLLPTLDSNLMLSPGIRALANLTMSATIEVGTWFPAQRRSPEEPSDDWRWTLRSASNRPLLRLAEDPPLVAASGEGARRSETHGQLSFVSGEGAFADGGTHQILTVQRFRKGGIGESTRVDLGEPAAPGGGSSVGLSAGFERRGALGEETRLVAGFASHPELAAGGAAGLQAFTLASSQKLMLGDAVMIDAGTLVSAERLVQSRIHAAPFVRVVVAPAEGYAVMYRYAADRALQRSEDVDNPKIAPEVLADAQGNPIEPRRAHQEVAVSHKSSKDRETVAIYQDRLPFATIAGFGLISGTGASGLPLITDESTGTFRLAVKGYTARGFSGSWTHDWTHDGAREETQDVDPILATTLSVEVGTSLVRQAVPAAFESLPANPHAQLEPALRAEAHGTIARSATRYQVQYRWQPGATLDSVDSFANAANQAYLSCSLRQKLWAGHRLQGLDAVLEATNLLEEGYQPMVGPDGQTLILAQVPRALQAGLSLSF